MPRIEWLGNLTARLTKHLTSCLTGYLTRGLTFSVAQEVSGVEQRVSGHGLEAVTALGLGSLQGLGNDGMVDASPVRDHVLPGFSLG